MKRLLYIVVVILLSGCIPVTELIYRPEAEGGKLRETTCGYNSGPGKWNEIEFERGLVRIKIQAQQRSDDLIIYSSILVPEGVSATVKSPEARLYFEESKKEMKLKIENYYWYENTKRMVEDINTSMKGRTFPERGDRGMRYNFDLIVPEKKPESFNLVLPLIDANGQPIALPKIHFQPDHIFLKLTLNC